MQYIPSRRRSPNFQLSRLFNSLVLLSVVTPLYLLHRPNKTCDKMLLYFFKGILWPLEAMPTALRYISYTLPQTCACEAMRAILLRGWGLTHPMVARYLTYLSTSYIRF
jgi:ABC-type multidrug transport system permease subunit